MYPILPTRGGESVIVTSPMLFLLISPCGLRADLQTDLMIMT
jgi:hypothetical protein